MSRRTGEDVIASGSWALRPICRNAGMSPIGRTWQEPIKNLEAGF